MAEGPGYTIEIDRERCMGSGLCEVYAAGTFAIDDEMKSAVVDVDGDPLETIRIAAEAGPTGAITVRIT